MGGSASGNAAASPGEGVILPMYSIGITPRPKVGAVGSIAGESPLDRGLRYVSSGEVRIELGEFFMSRSAVLT